jgi:fructokinase
LSEPHLILGIGELLWDLLPEGARLGGAPANFSVLAGGLGNHAAILSRIGRDDPGREAVARLDALPVDPSFLQVDSSLETGRVSVQLQEGQPSYTIHQPAAWDALELSDAWVQLAARADALCFGSLAQRSAQSRQTIQELVAGTASSCIRIFDVNLRPPYISAEVIQESLELATVVKMNEAELPQVLALLGLPVNEGRELLGEQHWRRRDAERLLVEFPGLDLVAITCGGQGSLLVRRGEFHDHPGLAVQVVDTVGAGDAFTAAMAHFLLRGADLATVNEAGNRWGSWIASQSGAMPDLPEAVRRQRTAAIEG